MLTLTAKIRKETRKKVKSLRQKGILPAVLYGPKTKPLNLEIDPKQFEKIFAETGESSLLSLLVEGEKSADKKEYLVLIHQIEKDPLTLALIHIDFYQPDLEAEVTVMVPVVFEGEAPAVKDLGGTLVKNIAELEVRAKPQNLPKEIKVNVEPLKLFTDRILIKDLSLSKGIRVLKDLEEVVALVTAPEKVEEELEKPIEEKVEEVEKVEEKKEAEPAENEE
ncbi:MAG: 50S ribosomal protein L25 [Candidatus Nealsonbacteria bacterium CG08_land_8_20_14_0_20_43_11]|uniref:Large ribosomal subunit protein bL25 n=1 Tax=Candidatus Nealsonbacteria bacterium CG08_land_8_20_14_0_20_43_11 TaxID=1974706 RepID=A0A2M6T1E7_9BACT|nr:MAG: 50S ribosomal protein L25 [Candidatus Nealsonbacteria bacterium CG08_land_8_20_14_0_20_43_11]